MKVPSKDSEVIELSPFLVSASQNVGYQAATTLAGTRLSTDLKDIGAAVSVYTKEFLDDIFVTRLEDILAYTTSTEGGGTNFSGVTGESSAAVREDPAAVNRVRALASATRTRDDFPSDLPTDTFNVDNLTISRGPNAVLARIGNAGGVIDSAMHKASFKDSYRFTSRFSSYNFSTLRQPRTVWGPRCSSGAIPRCRFRSDIDSPRPGRPAGSRPCRWRAPGR